MAALVAAALAGIGDPPARLAAILADRYRSAAVVIVAAAAALAAVSAAAVVAGIMLAPLLTPEAKLLMLAMALALQGGGALFPAKGPERLDGWRIGAVTTSFLGLLILLFGDGVQFIVVVLAARASVPWLAAVGATLGGLAVLAPAAVLGERAWLRLPLGRVRTGIAVVFLLAAAVIAVQALSLA